MFERIFKYHYSNKFAYALDAICIFIALEAILFLNGSVLIIRSQLDKPVFIALALGCITLFRGYKMVLRFTTFIDIGKIASGLILSIAIYALYIKARYTWALQLLIVAVLLSVYPYFLSTDW